MQQHGGRGASSAPEAEVAPSHRYTNPHQSLTLFTCYSSFIIDTKMLYKKNYVKLEIETNGPI